MEEYCQKIINVLYDDEKCKSVLCKIVDFIAMQPEIDFEDRKTFERKETTDMLLGRTSELKAYLNE